MAIWLVSAFILVPIAEIWLLIKVGAVIGVGWTLVLLVADAVGGAALVRHQGRRAWQALRAALQEAPHTGRIPTREVTDGALILMGGALLLAPGFITDVVGLLLVLPFTRPLVRHWMLHRFSRGVRVRRDL